MKILLATMFLISNSVLNLLAGEVKQTLLVSTPHTWKMEFTSKNGINLYSIKRKKSDTDLLMFSRWPMVTHLDQIPELTKAMARSFIETARNSKDFKLKSDKYVTKKIVGEQFSGGFVHFDINDELIQIIFVVGHKEEIWNGQFTGTKEGWTEALSILKKLKNKNM